MKKRKKKITSLFILTMISFAFTACSKDDGGSENIPNASTHTLVLKAETSSGSTLSHLLYGYDSNQTTVSGLGVATWTSLEIALPENASVVNFSANGVGIDAASTLKLQIFVDGVLKKEEVGTGTILSVRTHHNLR
jgi:pyridoxal biosynthesis lyase PdxS